MNISDKAVEAAHEQLEAMGTYVSRDYVEAALEAAAPHMLAEAWEEGEAAGQDNRDSNRGYNIEHKYNPYRSQA